MSSKRTKAAVAKTAASIKGGKVSGASGGKKYATPGLAFGSVASADKFTAVRTNHRSESYVKFAEQVKSLKQGDAFLVQLAPGQSQANVQNRVNAAMRRLDLTPPAGCRYSRCSAEGGGVIVSCVKGSPRKSGKKAA